jgi:hypothetical protein
VNDECFRVVVDWVGLVSGMVTLLGTLGVLSRVLLVGKRTRFDVLALEVLIGSFKIGLSVVAVSALVPVAASAIVIGQAMLANVFREPAAGAVFWDQSAPVSFAATYLLMSLFLVPLTVLIVQSIYYWSLHPFVRFSKKLRREKPAELGAEPRPAAPANGNLVIRAAAYGVRGSGTVDVTSQLQSLVRDGKLQVVADNNIAGDPAPWKVKQLVVGYEVGGVPGVVSVGENELCSIP